MIGTQAPRDHWAAHTQGSAATRQPIARRCPSLRDFFDAPVCSDADAVAAVLLVPVRAAMHGSFPLAGTYFQACVLRVRLRTIHMHADSTEELSCAVHEPTQSWTCSAFSMQINEMFLAHDTVAQPVQVWGAAVENLQVKRLRSSRQNVTC